MVTWIGTIFVIREIPSHTFSAKVKPNRLKNLKFEQEEDVISKETNFSSQQNGALYHYRVRLLGFVDAHFPG